LSGHVAARAGGHWSGGSVDACIIGGGIIGCSAAAFLAQAGASVVVIERDAIGAGASGRNQGVVQHPFDPVLATLHPETLSLYRELADSHEVGFSMADRPAGLLMVTHDEGTAVATAAELARTMPALRPVAFSAHDLRRAEPAMADGVAACRLETGYPIPPASATEGYARLARRRGARFEHAAATPWLEEGRCVGVDLGHERIAAGAVLLATGAWSADLSLGGTWRVPIRPLWGAVVSVRLANPPRHVLEEIGVDSIGVDTGQEDVGHEEVGHGEVGLEDIGDGGSPAHGRVPSIFSLATAADLSGIGATVLPSRPVEDDVAPVLVERGARFVPALRMAPQLGVRVCPRPISADGRPLLGPVPGVDRLFVAAGHGPWGISTGPASARLVTDLILGGDARILEEFSPARFGEAGA
jgi:glycine/D-amino acid oxidase-like deaminating enzyme